MNLVLEINILQRESSGLLPNADKELFFGQMAIVEAMSGTYVDEDNQEFILDMQPPERTTERQAIAITSSKFVGHERGTGAVGAARRVIDISKKKNTGSLPIDSYRKVTVALSEKKS